MKAYRNTLNQLPEDFVPVLAFEVGNDVAYVAYYDDGLWFEAHTSEPLKEVTYWMPIPLLPYQ
jgi:hypothetical protein